MSISRHPLGGAPSWRALPCASVTTVSVRFGEAVVVAKIGRPSPRSVTAQNCKGQDETPNAEYSRWAGRGPWLVGGSGRQIWRFCAFLVSSRVEAEGLRP